MKTKSQKMIYPQKKQKKISPGKAKKVGSNMEKISKFELVQTRIRFFRYCSLLKKKKQTLGGIEDG